MQVQVECEADQPVRFTLGVRAFTVADVLDRWYGHEGTYYKVRAMDGGLYILRHAPRWQPDSWSLDAYREEEESRGPRQ